MRSIAAPAKQRPASTLRQARFHTSSTDPTYVDNHGTAACSETLGVVMVITGLKMLGVD
jgi:hypothetical protein